MKIRASAFTAMVALVLLVTSCPSFANIRAPMRSEWPPSSALFSPSRDLTVLHEDLQFECDSSGCQVSATYRIRSEQPATLTMSFISPSSHVESVTVNEAGAKPGGVLVTRLPDQTQRLAADEKYTRIVNLIEEASKKQVAVSSPEYQQLAEEFRLARDEWERLGAMYDHHVEVFGELTAMAEHPECQSVPDFSTPKGWVRYVNCYAQGRELYQYKFDAAILAGENTLQVRYHQEYSSAEPYTSYFTTPSEIHYVSYELWPLKEWRRDPGFKIDLTVKFHNPRHGFMYLKRDGVSVLAGRLVDDSDRLFGLVRSSRNLPPNTLDQMPGGTLVYRTSMQGDIADRLFVITGEKDSLEYFGRH